MNTRAVPLVALALVALAGVLAFAASGCSGRDDDASGKPSAAASCPAAWRTGWQKLANRIGAPVYCPSWLPAPLTGEIGGPWNTSNSVGRDGSYLIGFLWHEHGNDVHVNLRHYAGRTSIPRCVETYTVAGVTRRKSLPCFSDLQGRKRVGELNVAVYTRNRDADEWHVLYAWRKNGSLYTLSEHVAPPYPYARVIENLDRMARSLELVEPSKS